MSTSAEITCTISFIFITPLYGVGGVVLPWHTATIIIDDSRVNDAGNF